MTFFNPETDPDRKPTFQQKTDPDRTQKVKPAGLEHLFWYCAQDTNSAFLLIYNIAPNIPGRVILVTMFVKKFIYYSL
jgi:hypothetical protein